LLNNLLDCRIQLTTYLLSRGLLSDVSRPVSCITTVHWPLTLHLTPWERPLGTKYYPFSYQLTDWFCSEDSTTCFSLCACVTFRRLSTQFFPLHQLRCYIHRSYQWTLGHPSEQACLHEPLLAELRRLTSFGCVTTVILRRAGRTILYRTINCP